MGRHRGAKFLPFLLPLLVCDINQWIIKETNSYQKIAVTSYRAVVVPNGVRTLPHRLIYLINRLEIMENA